MNITVYILYIFPAIPSDSNAANAIQKAGEEERSTVRGNYVVNAAKMNRSEEPYYAQRG